MNAINRQTGLTLVEILVALTLGVLILGGVMQISMANKESSRLQGEINFVQTNIRTATQMLTHDIRMAGFKTDTIKDLSTDRLAAVMSNANDDEITIAYESNTDCLGQATPAAAVGQVRTAVNRYFTQNLRLMCEGNSPGSTPQPLVDGVEGMQILFGENTDGDGITPNRYVAAPTMSSVVAIRIAMRFRGEQNMRAETDANKYVLLDSDAIGPYNDRLIRRETTLTIALRN
jgi:type IV pilus assembly protein PilW